MYYLVYKTTNLLNGKFYIGSHQTKFIDDNYYGSGRILKLALKKYGKENFKRDVICLCKSLTVCRSIEAQLVRHSIDKFGRECYNRSYNGTGAVLGEGNAFFGKKHSNETRKRLSLHAKSRTGKANPFYNKTHSKDTKHKIRETRTNLGIDNDPEIMKRFLKRSTRWFCTPNGCYYSQRHASKMTGLTKTSIALRCLNPDKVVRPNYQTDKNFWNKTWKENGYYFVDRITAKV